MDNIKILQLNVWGGRIKDGLTNFIKEGNYDLICLQEAVWDRNHTKTLEYFMDTVDKIKEEANFKYDTRSSQFGISILNNIIHYESGNAILSKIPFKHSEEKILHGEYRFATNLDQYEQAVKHNLYTAQKVILENGLTVINYHGYWLKDPLGDETSVLCMRSVADMISSDKTPLFSVVILTLFLKQKQCVSSIFFATSQLFITFPPRCAIFASPKTSLVTIF